MFIKVKVGLSARRYRVTVDAVRGHRRVIGSRWRRYGAGIDVLAAAGGRLLWASPALPGKTADITAAEHHGIITASDDAGITRLCDRGHIGAGGTAVHGRNHNRDLTDRDRHRDYTIAKLRPPAERANATLKQ